MAARASADDAADAERALPSWVRVVARDVRAALREGACEARTHRWRETDVVGALVRAVRRGAGDRGVGRVFTAANERGCAALVGEDAETVDGGGGGDARRRRARERGDGGKRLAIGDRDAG